jgi:hypothetical protein
MISAGRARWQLSALGLALWLGASAVGCRTSRGDIERWANTSQGPRKIVAVLIHDKYPLDLRVDAAMALVQMKPRGGRNVGIKRTDGACPPTCGLVDALGILNPNDRAKIVAKMVPVLEAEMKKPPPTAQAGQPAPSDPTVAAKDAAFALLTERDKQLVTDDAARGRLQAALIDWSLADFEKRLGDNSQLYGLEQVLRAFGAASVKGLPSLIGPQAGAIERMADLVAELGDPETKEAAGQKLVEVAKEINSQKWIDQKAPQLEAANKASKLTPTPEQFKEQLTNWQDESLTKILTSMKNVGGRAVSNFLLDFAADSKNTVKRRAAALAAVEGKLDKNNPKHVEKLLAIASTKDLDETILQQALWRLGEMPRKLVVEKLYELFKAENWKVRMVTAELVLKMSDASNAEEFMQRLGKASDGMSLDEPLHYGRLLAGLKGSPSPAELAERYAATSHPVAARLTALGYHYWFGTAGDLSKIAPFEKDATKVPKCREEAKGCQWKCGVKVGDKQEEKDVVTVGDYVSYCVKPAMEGRKEAPKTEKK